MLAKKSIEGGENLDDIPDSMRQLLAMQAIESGRPFPRQLMGRPEGPIPQYGSGGMLMNGDPNGTGKVGECLLIALLTLLTHTSSHPSLHLPFPEHRNLASRGSERYGPRHLLLSRQGLPDLLHQQRFCWLQDRVSIRLHKEHTIGAG